MTDNNTSTQLNTVEEIQTWLEKMKVKHFTVHNDLTVSGINLLLDNKNLSFLPFKLKSFEKVSLNGNAFSELTLPQLPSNLESLSIEKNNFKSLPELPKNLRSLNIKGNAISEIQALPPRLIKLNAEATLIKTLPNLPLPLKFLDVSHTQIKDFPELPSGLTSLMCSNNNLNSLPKLPKSLRELSCSNNKFTSLTLPLALEKLYCTNNLLTELVLPNKLEILYCNKNQITELLLPETIKILWIESNPLKSFNMPSNLERIALYTSQMDKMNSIPEKIRYLSLGAECLHTPNLKELSSFLSHLTNKVYLEGIAIPNIEKKLKHNIKINGKKEVQLYLNQLLHQLEKEGLEQIISQINVETNKPKIKV